VQKSLATRVFCAAAWDEGLEVYVWTVNQQSEIERFVAMGVQGLISDFPERFSKIRIR
jgi:glycerophosphoryl diester phosphodiesterase